MLTRKKKAFADEYLINGFNGTEAAKTVGYIGTTRAYLQRKSSALLNDPEIKLYIENRIDKVDNEKLMKLEELVSFLTNTVRGNETETIAFALKSGNKNGFDELIETTKIPVKHKDRLAAGKMLLDYHKLKLGERVHGIGINLVNNIPKKVVNDD